LYSFASLSSLTALLRWKELVLQAEEPAHVDQHCVFYGSRRNIHSRILSI
jgi:hypothetical protein